MNDQIYSDGSVEPKFKPIFVQLQSEFDEKYKVCIKYTNFGRWIDAAIVNPKTKAAAIVKVTSSGSNRTVVLSPIELQRIRSHNESESEIDLEI